ncbi:MAG: pyrrolysine--tRNA(Pyl) ligase large subunit [archaeon]|nr:pyrrolysine--tRNA(Pyl) ligase large subunit [archaeon]MCP8306047.1 pyrrolysine--tRNA(Pyl) ligase large subunit [archaeon]
MVEFTVTQKRRLRELNAPAELLERVFEEVSERDAYFDKFVSELVSDNKTRVQRSINSRSRSSLKVIEKKVAEAVVLKGFTEVNTPILIPRSYIERMGIDESNKLWKQIIWLEDNMCLRPMLAPNLYYIMRKIRRFLRPVRIFEIGPCFRKEEEGTIHSTEFTMANMVELAPERDPSAVLQEMISTVMKSVGLIDYEIRESPCVVYGRTRDILVNGIEVASAVVGPIPIDLNWDITEPWAGVGFGLERLAMLTKGLNRIKPVGRSVTYLDGIFLNI